METWNSYNYSFLHSSLCYQHSLSPQEISKTKRKITKLRKLPLSNSFPLFTGITFVDVSPFQNRLCQYLLANASRTNSPFLDYEVPDIWYFLLTFVCKLLGFLAVSFTRTGHHNKVIFLDDQSLSVTKCSKVLLAFQLRIAFVFYHTHRGLV